jgi:eukaryotic-like serine/threonine-protein kinase
VADEIDDATPVPTVARRTVVDRPSAVRRAETPEPDVDVRGSVVRGSIVPGSLVGSSGGGSAARSSQSLGAASPLEALDQAELHRTRRFAIVCFGISIVFGVVVWFLPQQYPILRQLVIGGITVTAGAMLYMFYRTHHPETFRDGIAIKLCWYVPTLTVAAAIPYGGAASPVVAIAVLGIYIIGMGAQLAVAAGVYATTAVAQGITGAIVIAGVADLGLIKSGYLPLHVEVLIQVLIQVILAATFVTARASRRSSLIAFEALERAVRAVAQREALLEEAREELRRALGTGRGRFTDHVIGDYRLGELLGRGAMGEVYDAVDVRTGADVAVKMLTLSSLGKADHVQRFMRELKTAATIDSPNVVRVLAVGDEPLPHLVMERLRGRDLSTLLRDKRLLPHDQVVDLIRQIGEGITAAHRVGVIHRDIKPQNLMLADTTWKILDFGVSRLAEGGDTLTAGQVVGTPSYMAPEQARGREVDARTDLYALAAVAYRALTGHAPYSGAGEVVETLYRVVHEAPRRPTALAKLPADIDYVLAIGLAKKRGDRFATAAEFADALAAALSGTLPEALRKRGAELVGKGAWSRAASAPV